MTRGLLLFVAGLVVVLLVWALAPHDVPAPTGEDPVEGRTIRSDSGGPRERGRRHGSADSPQREHTEVMDHVLEALKG